MVSRVAAYDAQAPATALPVGPFHTSIRQTLHALAVPAAALVADQVNRIIGHAAALEADIDVLKHGSQDDKAVARELRLRAAAVRRMGAAAAMGLVNSAAGKILKIDATVRHQEDLPDWRAWPSEVRELLSRAIDAAQGQIIEGEVAE